MTARARRRGRFLSPRLRGSAALVLSLGIGLGVGPALPAQEPSAPLPGAIDASPLPVVTIGEALRAALQRNPDVLNGLDALSSARWAAKAVAAGYLPQAVPFFNFDRGRNDAARGETYGISATEQFAFGTFLQVDASVSRDPLDFPSAPYASDYRVTLAQPLLGGADPAVTREPLREARRSIQGQERTLEVLRRRTVLGIYASYLGLARQLEATRLAAEHRERSHKLTEFSRARYAAGSVSRLDVLRAEQEESTAAVAENDAQDAIEDFRVQLRRSAGFPPELRFAIQSPDAIPEREPDLDEALRDVGDRRPEAIEARDTVVDSEFAVRIAKSLALPSLDGVVSYEASAIGATANDALRARNGAFLFGFRSRYGLNTTALAAARREADIALETRKRTYDVLIDDLGRDVRRTYRRLETVRRNWEIAVQNRKVAELQAEVAQLRFEKGLSDNFNVVDAENLYHAARLYELDSRLSILLAKLDCIFTAGQLDVRPFLQQP